MQGMNRVAASHDDIRLFSKALELLSSSHPDSEKELLELVKKAKRDADKEDAAKKTGATSATEVATSNSGALPVGGNSSHSQSQPAQSVRGAVGKGKRKRKSGKST